MENNDLCLIRKGGFILGPYTYEKTKTLLLQRELKVIDEVVFPSSHWLFLRDCPSFANIVEKLRKQDLISDEENTETVNRYSTSISYTSSMAKINNSELFEGNDKRHISAVEVLNSKPTSSAGHYGSPTYAKEKAKKGLWPIWLLLSVLIVVLAYVVLSHQQKSAEPVAEVVIDYTQQGLKQYDGGDYASALLNFQESYKEGKDYSEILIPYGALLLNDRQTVAASRVFNEAMDLGGSNKYKALVGMGLLSLLDGEVRFADKNFNEALSLNPEYMPALFNLGITYFYKNKFTEALNYFKSSYRLDRENEPAHVMHSVSLIKRYEKTQQPVFLDSAYKKLLASSKKVSNYKQESQLLMAYIQFLKNDTEGIESIVQKLIDTDPRLTEHHTHNLLLHDNPLNWVYLNQEFCRKIVSSGQLEASLSLQMLDALCLVKSGQLSFAAKRIESIGRQNIQNPLLGALMAYVQKESNENDEALVTIGNAIDNNRLNHYKLPSILQAQLCDEIKDYQCSLKFWTKVTSIEPSSLSAKVGRVAAQINLGQTPSSKKDLENLLELHPGYKPLIRLIEESSPK